MYVKRGQGVREGGGGSGYIVAPDALLHKIRNAWKMRIGRIFSITLFVNTVHATVSAVNMSR